MAYQTISILGCGWLGFPLAEHFNEKGYLVRGSTTTKDKIQLLEQSGIYPYYLTLEPELQGDRIADFLRSDILIVNIPPSSSAGDEPGHHLHQIKSLIGHLRQAPVRWVIYVSSTSVYPSLNRRVTEQDAAPAWDENGDQLRRSGKSLRQAEELLIQEESFDTTVLRLCGLYGPDRHPGRFLAGRSGVSGDDAPVNLIHLDDVIGLMDGLVKRDVRGQIFNGCSDEHPTRRELYTLAAQRMGLEPPAFRSEEQPSWKIVDSEKLKTALDYRFRHPDPLQALQQQG